MGSMVLVNPPLGGATGPKLGGASGPPHTPTRSQDHKRHTDCAFKYMLMHACTRYAMHIPRCMGGGRRIINKTGGRSLFRLAPPVNRATARPSLPYPPLWWRYESSAGRGRSSCERDSLPSSHSQAAAYASCMGQSTDVQSLHETVVNRRCKQTIKSTHRPQATPMPPSNDVTQGHSGFGLKPRDPETSTRLVSVNLRHTSHVQKRGTTAPPFWYLAILHLVEVTTIVAKTLNS
jgi:hypothetical protein